MPPPQKKKKKKKKWMNIGSGIGLVPSGNKALSDLLLTNIFVAISRH